MDFFHLHDKEKRKGNSDRMPRLKGSSPKVGPAKAACLTVDMESPPLIFHDTPSRSSGALLSGQLKLAVADPVLKVDAMEMALVLRITTFKPVSGGCPDCSSQSTELFRWRFLSGPRSFRKGTHSFPFSYLLPGNLPASTRCHLGAIEYILLPVATGTLEEYATPCVLEVKRALSEAQGRQSLHVFPPTNLSAMLVLPPMIHPTGEFPVQMRIDGVTEVVHSRAQVRRWRLRKLSWRLDEHSKIISAACSKHEAKAGGETKGGLHNDIRTIGREELTEGWKSDFDAPGGSIEIEFRCSVKPSHKPVCDIEGPTGLKIWHTLIVDIAVAEEMAPLKSPQSMTPAGTVRVLRMQFDLVLTERLGLGVSWDEEQPPVYEDMRASPPGYVRSSDHIEEPPSEEEVGPLETSSLERPR